MGDLEPLQVVGLALAGVGVLVLASLWFLVKTAFRTIKLLAAVGLIAAGALFYVNGGADEVQQRIEERRQS